MSDTVLTEDCLRGAIWGQFVGDAICMGTHWIYNLEELQRLYPDGLHGFEAPHSGHYHDGKQPGDFTHYGDGALVLLESVAACGGLDAGDYGRRFVARFGSPEYTGYLDKATRGTLENFRVFQEESPEGTFDFQQGADDDQLATASRLAPVVAVGYDDPELPRIAVRATRVCQRNRRAEAYMQAHARLLAELIRGRDEHTALHRVEEMVVRDDPEAGAEVRRKIRDGMQAAGKGVEESTLEFGQACPLGSSFPSAIHCFVTHAGSYPDAVLATLRAGGDSAGRAAMIGAWLGARLGMEAIPAEWRKRLRAHDRIAACVEAIVT